MTKQTINIGETANDRNADSLRTAFQKINANFTDLYTSLGLDTLPLNLGAFEFTGSTLSTTDSSSIIIDQAVEVTSDLTVSGDIVPSNNLSSTLGSPTKKFHSIYVGTGSVYLGDAKLSLQNGRLSSNVGFDLTNSVGVVGGTVSYADVTNKPTITGSQGITATTDVNGNVTVGFGGILYVGSQTQYGFEEIVDESGPSPVYSSRLSLPLTTEFLGGDISLTAWGLGVNIKTRNPDPFTDYTWSFRYDGTLIAPSTIAFGDGNRTNIDQINNNFVITTNTGPGDPYSWTFDEFGNLTLPGGAVVDTYGDGASNSTYLWSAPGEVIAVRSMIAENNFGGGIDVNPDGSVDIIAQNTSSASWTFNDNGSLTFPNLTTQTTAWTGSVSSLVNSNKTVSLGADGTLTVPSPTSPVFTLMFAESNYVPTIGKPTLTLTGTPWELHGQYAYTTDGRVAPLMLDSMFPTLSNPGYTSGDSFTFDESIHGFPGYTLTITLTDVVQAGPAGWTANVEMNPSPAYPSTVTSQGAIKFTANNNSLILGTAGEVKFPATVDGQLFLSGSEIAGVENNSVALSSNTSVVINTYNPSPHTWAFGNNGSLAMPGDITQSYQDNTTCPPNVDTVIYTSTGQLQHAIKLFVMVEGFTEGGGVSWDTQACDIIAVKGYNNNVVHVTTYGVTYTGAGAIATFDGQWNATTTRIEITCRPTGAINSVVASVHAIEMSSND